MTTTAAPIKHAARMAWMLEGLSTVPDRRVVTDWGVGEVSCVRVGAKWAVVGCDEMSDVEGDGGWMGFATYDADPEHPDDVDAAEADDEILCESWDEAREKFRAFVAANR